MWSVQESIHIPFLLYRLLRLCNPDSFHVLLQLAQIDRIWQNDIAMWITDWLEMRFWYVRIFLKDLFSIDCGLSILLFLPYLDIWNKGYWCDPWFHQKICLHVRYYIPRYRAIPRLCGKMLERNQTITEKLNIYWIIREYYSIRLNAHL